MLGKRISEENLSGSRSERYGIGIIDELSEQLTNLYGRGFDKRSLYRYAKFFRLYPKIVVSVTPQSLNTFSADISRIPLLTWTHYTKLMQVVDSDARAWYEKEAREQSWSVRTLQRNIDTQYYDRMLLAPDKLAVEAEMKQLTSPYQGKLEFIRNPVIAEFLGMQEDSTYLESDLEQAIIGNLQKFLMELGKGYAFVARQQHIYTEKQDYYLDLVFYNYILKCFILLDLRIGKITHQDVAKWICMSGCTMN